MDKENYQCLLFLVPKVTTVNVKEIVNHSAQNNIKGFVLLPPSIIENGLQIVELFARNNIEILTQEQCLPSFQCALVSDEVEVLELIIAEVGQRHARESESSTFYRVSVKRDNEDLVRLLFGRDAAVCTYDDYSSYTCKAIDSKNVVTMEHILGVKADIQFRSLHEGTLLHFAVSRYDETLVTLLLKHNANVNARMKASVTALHLAAKLGQITTASLLLEKGASVDARCEDGATSLLLAAVENQHDIVSLLLEHGSDVNIGTHAELTPLHVAAANGDAEIVNDLLQYGANVNATMTYCRTEGITPLCFAVEEERSAAVKRLLECGADVDSPSYDGQTVLGLAVDEGNLEIIQSLLEHQPDVNNKTNKRALRKSLCQDDETSDEIVKMFLEHGFTIDVEDIYDSELFHQAIRKNYFKIVEQLLSHGVDVNKLYRYKDTENDRFQKTTPLITAIRSSETDMIRLLVKYGADVKFHLDDIVNSVSTLVDEAVKSQNLEAVKVLHASGADMCPEKILHFAIKHNCLELVEELLSKGAKVTGSCNQFITPIVLAAGSSSVEMVQLLRNFGASVDSRDNIGRTALHTATLAFGERLDMIRFLVQNNADIDARCFYSGATPISQAVSDGHLKTIDTLLKFGANINRTDNTGGSPLHYAVTNGRMKILKALLDYGFNDMELIQKTNISQVFSKSFINSLNNQNKFRWLCNSFEWHKEFFVKSARILARHVMKIQALFSDCAPGSSKMSAQECLSAVLRDENVLPIWYRNESKRNRFLSYCETEIAELKTEFVDTTNVTFYDILTKDTKQLSCYMRNAKIVQKLQGKDYKCKFPIYAGVLFFQFRKGIQRKNFLNRAIKSFHRLCRHFKKLPRNVKEDLLNYLTNKELEILAYASTQTNANRN